jgi:uncharacterized membrane protein YkvA (DUF1232 family)
MPETRARETGWMAVWKQKARGLKIQTAALYYACRDPRVPWYAKALAGAVVAYAFSPIDLIPDFIPILGYLDDLVIIPLGVSLALKMVPPAVMAECKVKAEASLDQEKPIYKLAGAIIILFWLVVLAWLVWTGVRIFHT